MGGIGHSVHRIPRIAGDYPLIRPEPRVLAVNEFLFAIALAGLVLVATIVMRAAAGLFGLLMRGVLLAAILAMIAIAFVI